MNREKLDSEADDALLSNWKTDNDIREDGQTTVHLIRSHRAPRPKRNLTKVAIVLSAVMMANGAVVVTEHSGPPSAEVIAQDAPAPPVEPLYSMPERDAMVVGQPASRSKEREREPLPLLKREVIKIRPPAPAVPKLRPVVPPKPTARVEVSIRFALAQVGKPYVFGASGPRAYDCSGLVMAAFARIGVRLPHYTGAMMRYGRKISRSQLQRGDIVFPSSGHVSIYLGNGMIVHASNPRTDIKVSKLYSFYTARRISP